MELKRLQGIVVESYGSFYHIDLGQKVVPCVLRGKFRQMARKNTNPLVVGDRVTIFLEEPNRGIIEEILPRTTQLSRPSPREKNKNHLLVANVTQAVIVASVHNPKVPLGFLDRLLIACQDYDLQPLICINKTDLIQGEEELEKYGEIYEKAGAILLFVSAHTGHNMEVFRQALQEHISVFVGQSGVGKSSLLNALEPSLDLKVGSVSLSTNKGRHTTTYASLRKLSSGGYVADTPGLKEFGLRQIPIAELSYYFPEMEEYLAKCKFKSCLHLTEPKCGVRQAVEAGEIHSQRYSSYCSILASLKEEKPW